MHIEINWLVGVFRYALSLSLSSAFVWLLGTRSIDACIAFSARHNFFFYFLFPQILAGILLLFLNKWKWCTPLSRCQSQCSSVSRLPYVYVHLLPSVCSIVFTLVHFDTWLPQIHEDMLLHLCAERVLTWPQRMGCDKTHMCRTERFRVVYGSGVRRRHHHVVYNLMWKRGSVALTHRQLVGNFRVFPLVIYLFSCFFSPFSFCFSRIKSSFSIVVVVVCLSFGFCSWSWAAHLAAASLCVIVFVFRRLSCCRSTSPLATPFRYYYN